MRTSTPFIVVNLQEATAHRTALHPFPPGGLPRDALPQEGRAVAVKAAFLPGLEGGRGKEFKQFLASLWPGRAHPCLGGAAFIAAEIPHGGKGTSVSSLLLTTDRLNYKYCLFLFGSWSDFAESQNCRSAPTADSTRDPFYQPKCIFHHQSHLRLFRWNSNRHEKQRASSPAVFQPLLRRYSHQATPLPFGGPSTMGGSAPSRFCPVVLPLSSSGSSCCFSVSSFILFFSSFLNSFIAFHFFFSSFPEWKTKGQNKDS